MNSIIGKIQPIIITLCLANETTTSKNTSRAMHNGPPRTPLNMTNGPMPIGNLSSLFCTNSRRSFPTSLYKNDCRPTFCSTHLVLSSRGFLSLSLIFALSRLGTPLWVSTAAKTIKFFISWTLVCGMWAASSLHIAGMTNHNRKFWNMGFGLLVGGLNFLFIWNNNNNNSS